MMERQKKIFPIFFFFKLILQEEDKRVMRDSGLDFRVKPRQLICQTALLAELNPKTLRLFFFKWENLAPSQTEKNNIISYVFLPMIGLITNFLTATKLTVCNLK